MKIARKPYLSLVGFVLLGTLLCGCPKRVVRMPPVEVAPVKNPVNALLEAFSPAENFESKASIRLEMVQNGQRMNFLLNGSVFFQRPDKLRILGYHPFGMELFDALYRSGEFFILNTYDMKVYTGEVSDFEDLMERARVQIATDKNPGDIVPNRIRIGVRENETRVDIRLKEISTNHSLPRDTFLWSTPNGVQTMPLAQLLR